MVTDTIIDPTHCNELLRGEKRSFTSLELFSCKDKVCHFNGIGPYTDNFAHIAYLSSQKSSNATGACAQKPLMVIVHHCW